MPLLGGRIASASRARRRWRVAISVTSALVAAALVACSLLPFDDLADQPDSAVVVDSAIADSSAADTALETTTAADSALDAGHDGAVDAAPDSTLDADADAPLLRFCESHTTHTFCEDFDWPNVDDRWNMRAVVGDATLDVDDAAAVSPPNSLLAAAFAYPGNHLDTPACYIKHFTGKAKHITVELAARVDAIVPSSNGTTFARVVFNKPLPGGWDIVEVGVHVGATLYANGYGFHSAPDGGDLSWNSTARFSDAMTTFRAVTFDVDLETATATASLGSATTDAAPSTFGPVDLPPSLKGVYDLPFDVEVGIANIDNGGATKGASCTVRIDDVLVDVDGG